MPEVSIVIPVFNAVATVERAIWSAVQQNVDCEIILVDDQSSDDSVDHIKRLSLKYGGLLRLIELPENKGASYARNVAIAHANAPFLAFLDADDVWLPGKLKAQLDLIKSSTNVHLVTCDCFRVHPDGRVLSRSHDRLAAACGADAWMRLLKYNFIPTPSVLTRTKLVQDLGGFREDLVAAEDLDMWIKIGKTGRIEVIRSVYVHYFDYALSLNKRGKSDHIEPALTMLKAHAQEANIEKSQFDEIFSHRHTQFGLQCLRQRNYWQAFGQFLRASGLGARKRILAKYFLAIMVRNVMSDLTLQMRVGFLKNR